MNDWKKQFRKSIRSWIEKEGPYWPDWDQVEKFIEQALTTQKETLIKEMDKLETKYAFINGDGGDGFQQCKDQVKDLIKNL